MCLERFVHDQLLQERLRPPHPSLVVGLRSPNRPQIGDELVKNGQALIRHVL
jgi:hypothetical protein